MSVDRASAVEAPALSGLGDVEVLAAVLSGLDGVDVLDAVLSGLDGVDVLAAVLSGLGGVEVLAAVLSGLDGVDVLVAVLSGLDGVDVLALVLSGLAGADVLALVLSGLDGVDVLAEVVGEEVVVEANLSGDFFRPSSDVVTNGVVDFIVVVLVLAVVEEMVDADFEVCGCKDFASPFLNSAAFCLNSSEYSQQYAVDNETQHIINKLKINDNLIKG